MKIWWQTSTPLLSPTLIDYRTALMEHVNRLKRHDVEVTFSGVDMGSLSLDFNFVVFLNSSSRGGGVLQKILRAEREGYDGVAIGCFLDPALLEARELVDIPVLSLGETSMHIACMLGDKFSGVAFADKQAQRYNSLARSYGLGERLVPFSTMSIDFETLSQGFREPAKSRMLDSFDRAAKEVVEAGAEVVIPACGCLDLILAQEGITEMYGARILDCDAVLIKITEAMVELSEIAGVRVSRKLLFAQPDEERREEILSLYGLKPADGG